MSISYALQNTVNISNLLTDGKGFTDECQDNDFGFLVDMAFYKTGNNWSIYFQ